MGTRWDYAVKTMLGSLEDDRLHQQRLLDGDMDSIRAALRRKHVRNAIADSRIEGLPPPSPEEEEIWEAYIRGEIEAKDLVDVIKKAQQPFA
jgi:Antitoxin VbhA